jgi:sulfate adenylyltransferase
MTEGLIAPHGGSLINRLAEGAQAEKLAEVARSLPLLRLAIRPLSDLEMLATGAFSPLSGFMGRRDYESVVKDMHLQNGLPWSLPVTVSAPAADARAYESKQIALGNEDGEAIAVMDVEEAFEYDKKTEARLVYRTEEEAHPGVAAVYGQEDMLLSGQVTVFNRQRHATFPRVHPEVRHGDRRRPAAAPAGRCYEG